MKKIKNVLLLITTLAISMAACHSHNEDEDDMNPPVIVISAPTAGASISGAVTLTGLVTDESLHEMSIKITKDSDGSVLYTTSPVVHDLTSYTIADIWTPSGISSETAVTLKVEAEDHNSHKVTSEVKFTVKP